MGVRGSDFDDVAGTGAAGGDWPRTGRLLPWLLAAFLAMVFLVPFDLTNLPYSIGVDATLDRFALLVIAALWLFSFAAGGPLAPKLRLTAVHAAVGIFLVVVVGSIALNLPELVGLAQIKLATKKLALLLSYIAFFVVVSTTLRPSELRNFGALIVGLACLTAIGTIYEYRSGTNLFFEWRNDLLGGWAKLTPEPQATDISKSIVGPTQHGLAVTAMLAMALPFAMRALVDGGSRREKILTGCAAGLILAGMVATQRKTAVIVPAAVLVAMLAFRPRRILQLAPLGVVLVLGVQVLAPGALGSTKARLFNASEGDASTIGRSRDYDAVQPDVLNRPATGRGFGSFEPHKYRILDNDYLGLLIETGAAGIVAFALLLVSVILVARPAIRSGDPVRGPPALAAAAGTAGFAVVTFLFDSLSFAQAPYMFFFLAAVAAVCARSAGGFAPQGRPA